MSTQTYDFHFFIKTTCLASTVPIQSYIRQTSTHLRHLRAKRKRNIFTILLQPPYRIQFRSFERKNPNHCLRLQDGTGNLQVTSNPWPGDNCPTNGTLFSTTVNQRCQSNVFVWFQSPILPVQSESAQFLLENKTLVPQSLTRLPPGELTICSNFRKIWQTS